MTLRMKVCWQLWLRRLPERECVASATRKHTPDAHAPAAQIFETFEDPSYSTFAKWYSIAMMLLIVLATACFVLESEAEIETGVLYNTSALVCSRSWLPHLPVGVRDRVFAQMALATAAYNLSRPCLRLPAPCARACPLPDRLPVHRDDLGHPLFVGVRDPLCLLSVR